MKKLMFYVLPFLLVLSLFGCTNSEETGDLPEILIGSDTYPPYLYFDNNGNPSYEKHKVFLYKEDFDKFVEGLEEAIGVVKAAINGELPEKNTDL